MRVLSTCLGLSLATLSCGSSSADDKTATHAEQAPAFTITDEGSGPPNAKPLWPLTPGSRYDLTHVLGEREVDGRRVIVVARDGDPAALNWTSYTYYTESADGLLLHGSMRDGFSERPVLVVPKTVREGMSWTSNPGADGPSKSPRPLLCTAHTGAPSLDPMLLPAARPWFISCNDGYLFSWSEKFAEGIGPLPNGRLDLRDAAPSKAKTESEPPLTKLEPLQGGKPLAEGFFPHRVGAIKLPADNGGIRIVAVGEGTDFLTGGVADVDNSANSMAVSAYVPSRGRYCAFLDGDSFDGAGPSDDECPDPLGAAVGGDGKLRSIPAGNYCLENGDRCSPYVFLAIRGDERGAEVLAHSDWFYSGRYYDGSAEHPWYRIDEPERACTLLGGLGLLDLGGYSLLFGKKGAPDESLLVQNDGGAEVFTGGWNGRWNQPHPAFIPAALSAYVSQDGRDVLDVTPDGRISRVSVDNGELKLSFLARVQAPPKQPVVGALDRGNDLVVFTLGEHEGWRTQVSPGPNGMPTADTSIKPKLGNLYAWIAKPSQPPGEPAAPPAERTPIYMQSETRDLRLCTREPWQEPASTPSVSGFPALGSVQVDEHCGLILRDPAGITPVTQLGVPEIEQSAFEGDLPGIGHVRVGRRQTDPGVTVPSLDAGGELAPLAGGGLINATSPFFSWGPGGVLENGTEGVENGENTADVAGNGFWAGDAPAAECTLAAGCSRVTLRGKTIQHFEVTDPTPDANSGSTGSGTEVQGGGMLTARYVLYPDGSTHFFTVPTAPLGAEFSAGGALADGTVCGNYDEHVVEQGMSGLHQTTMCIAPDGSTRTSPTLFSPYHVTADGSFYGFEATSNELSRLDPKAVEITKVDLTGIPGISTISPGVPSFIHDGKGELFAVFGPPPGSAMGTWPVILHLTGTSVESVPMPQQPDSNFSTFRIIADETAFLFLGAPGSRGVLRVKR